MFHAQGIVLKRNFYREFDDVFTVFTKDFGKVEILGRGVKRPLAKLNSHLQVFDFSEVEFVLGKKFKVLTGANLVGNLFSGNEARAFARAMIDFLNFIDEAIILEDPDENVWNLIIEMQKFVSENNTIDKNKAVIFSNFFKFRLSSICGFEPVLDGCVLCSKKLKEGRILFSLKDGGVICEDCGSALLTTGSSTSLTASRSFQEMQSVKPFFILPSTIKLLRIFAKQDKDLLFKIKLSENEIDDLARTMNYFVKWNMG